MAGGASGRAHLSSVLSLLPGASTWISLAALPRPLYGARASIVGGRLRLTGGDGPIPPHNIDIYNSEVKIDINTQKRPLTTQFNLDLL